MFFVNRRSIWEWAVDYVGDRDSFNKRGDLAKEFLRAEGMTRSSRVLDLGCGCLSAGIPLIRYLDAGCFVGLDPNGWLVEAALEQHPDLIGKEPRFLYASDFGSAAEGPFDFVFAHSLLSHVAHWEMAAVLHKTREAVGEGAVWLASLRLDQYDSFSPEWVYPANSFFRLETVRVLAYYAGWHIERRVDLQTRMIHDCPSDLHDWLKLTAIPRPAEMNAARLDLEDREQREMEIRQIAEEESARRELARLEELERAAELEQALLETET